MKINTELDNGLLSETIVNNDVRIEYKNKEEYIGEVIEGNIREGWGIFKYSNGDIYEGYFKNGVREGKGEYRYRDGSVYRGEWFNDMKNGYGTFQVDKKEFDGIWQDDNFKEGMIYKINSLKVDDNVIDKMLEDEIVQPKLSTFSSVNIHEVINSFRTPMKNTRSTMNITANSEFRIDSPKKTPTSIKASNIYKEKNYYEKEYNKHIKEMLDYNPKISKEHVVDIEIRSCILEDKRITKTLNRILQNKYDGNYHYESCKGQPCLCSTIQNYIWSK
jgi:hypothetical protein